MTLYCLGARPAQTRAQQPSLNVLKMMVRRAPNQLERGGIDPKPSMLGNDILGNCTSVGIANHLRATAALAGFEVGVRDVDAVRFYAQSTGYQPGNPATDQGGVEVDVLTYAARNGYGLRNDTLYPIWGSADPADLNGMRNIMAGMGAAYLGVRLALADQHDGVWDTSTPGDQTPGSWGGHCLLGWSYTGIDDEDLVSLLTWGTVRQATWRWIRSRVMECHGLAWRQLVPASGRLPGGEGWDTLVATNRTYLGE
ncbi:hypothetical protein AA103196_2330 [Ameyamaea chiangmaiensis NBRC 103196]|uniref:Uncharacterized protein n=1 Tax=Ameyamaea chiangmaiensis TaxID=442969 RepID=A0A850PCT5_9PROT|nr:hypothetical protein [Ameyamaea chiangmaiensis]MBS4075411.1 hypothetical protein [Ameyamaea chiangmaiensis]NVN40320.1 hypothetical protein [Ameyamaea chiangmaiensis]GBQ69849.1 hypothetical protein AA103196_2330 [Ameyamaea chiangmaiensis NBRC 103196]